MDLVDFHSHFFARPFFDALAEMSPLEDPLDLLASTTPIQIPPPDLSVHLERWINELETNDVSHLVTFASLAQEIPAVAEAAANSGGKITPIALIDPTAGDDLRPLLNQGFRGVLLFPAMHHFRLADQKRLLGPLDDCGAIVYVHCGLLVIKLRDLLQLPRPYDLTFANPLDIIPAANAFPNVKFVIPHFGAGFFRETLMAGTQCENIYVDTSSTNSWIRTQADDTTLADVFRRSLDVFGAERILFGTDSNVFPAGWRRDRLEEQQAILDELGVGSKDQAQIFGLNARRLLGLPS